MFFYAYSTGTPKEDGTVNEHFLDLDGRPLDIYEEAARVSRALDPIKPLLLRLQVAPHDRQVVYWENLPVIHGQTFVHQETGDRYLTVLNSDLEAAQPMNLEFGFFQQYLSPDDRFFRALSGEQYDAASLREQRLEPGCGELFLIGQQEALQRHQRWMEQHAPSER